MKASLRKLTDSAARLLFVFSLCLLAMGYGVIAGYCERFPLPQLRNALAAVNALREVFRSDSVDGDSPSKTQDHTYVRNHGSADDGALFLVSGGPGYLQAYNPGDGGLAWLLDRKGTVKHVWKMKPDIWADLEEVTRVPGCSEIYPIGVHLLKDGSLIASFQGINTWPFAVGIARFDKDSNLIWKRECLAHHWFIVTPDRKILTPTLKILETPQSVGLTRGRIKGPTGKMFEDTITVMSLDGEILEEISMLQAIHDSGLIGLYQGAWEPTENLDVVTTDPLHLNCVQRVGEQVAATRDWLNPDDLLVSFRSLNTVAILDRATLQFKWFTSGTTLRQHSPRFTPNGDILVFDNAGGNELLGGTRLARISLDDRRAETLFPSREHESLVQVYSRTAGHLDLNRDGTAVLMAVSKQSTVFEISLDDPRVLWEYHFADAKPPHQILTAKYCYDVSFEMNQTEAGK